MSVIQFSAGQGPVECQLALAKAVHRFMLEAQARSLSVLILEQEAGEKPSTLRSALLSVEGEGHDQYVDQWIGSILWVCASPYRPKHGRKNWYVGVFRCAQPEPILDHELRFETTRSSGPGGQHVNKTESAVRATHVTTGITVKVQTERSQHANKRLAILLIAHRLANRAQEALDTQRLERHLQHDQLIRGNPKRTFKGMAFEPSG